MGADALPCLPEARAANFQKFFVFIVDFVCLLSCTNAWNVTVLDQNINYFLFPIYVMQLVRLGNTEGYYYHYMLGSNCEYEWLFCWDIIRQRYFCLKILFSKPLFSLLIYFNPCRHNVGIRIICLLYFQTLS